MSLLQKSVVRPHTLRLPVCYDFCSIPTPGIPTCCILSQVETSILTSFGATELLYQQKRAVCFCTMSDNFGNFVLKDAEVLHILTALCIKRPTARKTCPGMTVKTLQNTSKNNPWMQRYLWVLLWVYTVTSLGHQVHSGGNSLNVWFGKAANIFLKPSPSPDKVADRGNFIAFNN